MPVTANTVHVTTRDEVVERTKTGCAMFYRVFVIL